MKKISLFIIFTFLVLINVQSNSQTADDIIQKYTEAIGGKDNIKSVKTLIMSGKVTVHGMDLPLTITFKRPGKVRIDVTLQGMTQTQAFDGSTAWQIEFMKSKIEKMSDEQAKSIKIMADFEGLLVKYKEKGYTAELLGEEKVDSADTYKILITNVSGDSIYYYIDTKTFLTAKRMNINKRRNVMVETYFESFKNFSGLVLPVSLEIRQEQDEEASQKVTLENVVVNPEVDDSIFKMPEVNEK
ncbi:MAG TPA: outer membrane lipoprotein-sorting protein [Ignavibacteria bacterium]|jgi:outer membrane lipoprotein-sorting protein